MKYVTEQSSLIAHAVTAHGAPYVNDFTDIE